MGTVTHLDGSFPRELIEAAVREAIAAKFAEDVVNGRLIWNPETDTFCSADLADEKFRADAVAAWTRLLISSGSRP